MPLFFVLSGFVIHLNYARLFRNERPPRAMGEFLIARFARLYPLYLFFFVFGLISDFTFNWLREFPGDFMELLGYGITMTQSWVYIIVVNQRLLLENAFGLGWSVSTEWFFYIVYLGLVVTFLRLRTRRATVICIGAFSLAAPTLLVGMEANYDQILSFARVHFASVTTEATASSSFHRWLFYYSPYVRVLEFVLGCLTAHFYAQLSDRSISEIEQRLGVIALWAALLGLAAIGVVYVGSALPPLIDYYFRFLILNFGCAPPIAVVIFCVARYSSGVARLLGSLQLVRLGDISYSIYAVHTWTLRPFIRPAVPPDPIMLMDSIIRIPLAIAFTIIVATATYRLIEVPSRAFIRERLSRAMATRRSEVTGAAPVISPAEPHHQAP
jgi:peptidoglycan/LPS O-acetylase OafA/YrhL